jgi:putative hydrolase of the HAD superfamily
MFAVAFALGGTLTIEDRIEQRSFLELARGLCAHGPVPFDEAAARRIADDLFPADRDELDARPHELAEALSALADRPFPERVVVARFRQLAGRLAGGVRTEPEVRPFLARLASLRVPSAVLCDGWSTIAQRRAACAGFAGPVLVSEDLGVTKPSAAAFETLVRTVGLPAERVWYVGSDPARDVAAAWRAGLRAIWLNRAGAAYPDDIVVPARTIRSLDELVPELCEEYTRSLLGLRYILHTTLAWRPGHFVPGVEYGLNDPASLPPLM